MWLEAKVFEGSLISVLAVRPRGGGRVDVFLIEDDADLDDYKAVLEAGPPYDFPSAPAFRRPCSRLYEDPVIELMPPPMVGRGSAWPWIVAVYCVPECIGAHRGHWAFLLSGDGREAREVSWQCIDDLNRIYQESGIVLEAEFVRSATKDTSQR